ncbi:hypothetical protein EJV44_22415 [Ancylobacter aquaticus]|nr:hypothetical protein EJV44_22415 [Ancylobacter aquaticus]
MSDLILVSIAVPEALIADARQLARCIGYSAADEGTFREPSWQDGGGNLYAVASGPVWPAFLMVPYEPLKEPEWGADMAAASKAHEVLVVTDCRPTEDNPDPVVEPADPAFITAVVGLEGLEALTLMGLTPIPLEEPDL